MALSTRPLLSPTAAPAKHRRYPGDLLTGYNGKTITSDTIGNMLSDGTWTYTWEHGRELATMSNGSTTWTNTYNADGLRTKRTNGSATYNYIYNGSSLSQMTVGSNTLYFAYDASGTPMSVTYNGTNYYYATNVQGDVTAILNASGTAVVQYTYDAWGKILTTTGSMASTLGAHNPLRYRGYVYDTESTLYYLQSRYYDPEIGRFINADGLMSTGQGVLGNNMFAYCNNNPVVGYDPTGSVPQNAFFYVCYDGVGGKPISGHSDGENGSDALLEYVCNNFMPNTNSTVYVDVTYVGIYTQKTSSNVSDFFAILGGISLFALIPAVKEVAMLSGMLTVAGTASSVYGLVGLFTPETLPDKDYYQYKVTISWVETTTVVGYPDVFVQTRYNVMMWFLWDDTSYTSPTWYAQNSSWDEYRTEFHIKGG